MKHVIKKNLKAIAGALILAIALTVPPLAHPRTQTQPTQVMDPATDEEPHIGLEDLDPLLIVDDQETISRHLSKTPGLRPDLKDPAQDVAEERKQVKRLQVQEEIAERTRQEEETKRLQAEREKAAQKEAAKKEAAKKQKEKEAAQTTPAEPPPTETEPVPEPTPAEGTTETNEEAVSAPSAVNQFLIQIEHPDPAYTGRPLAVADRKVLEGLVMGEWGNDYVGAVLVAQCIRDSMVKEGTNSTAAIKRKYGYTAPVKSRVSDTVKKAVAYVFDQGGSGVQHPIYYFYASNITRGKWHETQKFVVQRQAVRFFSPYR